MPTKPIVLPRAWATNAVYTTGPFAGSPGKVDPGIGVAAEGHRPGAANPTTAEHENYQQRQITAWINDWVALGSFTGAANAHPVETNSAGRSAMVGLTLVDGVDETVLDITGANTLAPAVLVTSDATCYQADLGAAGIGFSAPVDTSTGTGFLSNMTRALGVGVNVTADADTTGDAVVVEHAGGGVGVRVTATGTGSAMEVLGSGLANFGAVFTGGLLASLYAGGVGNAFGLIAQSSTTAGAGAVAVQLSNNTGTGVSINTPAGSTTAARGLHAIVSGDATAAELDARGDGYPLILRSGASPAVGQVKFLGMNVDPVDTVAGQIAYNGNENLLKIAEPAEPYRAFHASVGGFTYGIDIRDSLVPVHAVWAVLATKDITGGDAPRVAGRSVTIRVSFSARSVSGLVAYVSYRVLDNGPPFGGDPPITVFERDGVGTGATAAHVLAVATNEWQSCVTITVPYVIPAAGDRNFTLEVRRSGTETIGVRDGSLEVWGLY